VPELVVDGDVASRAVQVFLEAAPRLVSLAGGRTPEAFYRALAGVRYPWSEVELLMGDERCVPAGHPDSNRTMVERSLLASVNPSAFHPLDGEGCDSDAADRRIRGALGGRSLDMAILGLGTDGHTASLFPGSPAVREVFRPVAAVHAAAAAIPQRVTLTLPVLAGADVVSFLALGPEKAEAVARAFSGPADPQVPASMLRSRSGVTVVILDRQAAAKLDN
jgi:6-phosphogluconolactonase